MSASAEIRIIGLGNPLMGDDGLGPEAVRRLKEIPLLENVEVIDGGTGGLSLLHLMEGAKHVLFIDAVEMGAPPGTFRVFDDAQLRNLASQDSPAIHNCALPEVLALAQCLGDLCPVRLYGVQPQKVERGIGLSPPVEQALDRLIEEIQSDLMG